MDLINLQSLYDSLDQLGCRYAFYFQASGKPAHQRWNEERFHSASIIKIPILLAWLRLEKTGSVQRDELCDLDAEPQVQGAGFSWLLHARRLPYADVLLMMIALSDNLCTNLIIRRAGLERLNEVFRTELGLTGTELQRKLMDYEARSRGLDNWISPQDCIRYFDLVEQLPPNDRQFVDGLFSVNQDDFYLRREIERDTLEFCHKTGSIEGVLHDWGYTRNRRIFLLTEGVQDERAALQVFGRAGRLLVTPSPDG